MNKKKLNILMPLAALLLLLLSSCSFIFDDYPEDEDHMKAIIMLSLSRDGAETRAAFPATGEEAITSARIIVFSGSAVEHNQVYSASNPPFDNPIRITVATGTKTIYVVTNESSAAMANALAAVQSEGDIQEIMADEISAGLAAPFVMIGKETVTLSDPGLSNLTVIVKRVAAKINLQFKKDTDAEVKITKVSLLNNTTKSTLWEGGATVESQTYWNHATNLSTPQTLTATPWDALTLYVYENLGNSSSSANATQLELEGTFDGTFTTYRVYVNEEVPSPGSSSGSDPSSSTVGTPPAAHYYNIKRNHEYRLTGTITRIGEYSSLYIDAKIRPWTTHENQVPLE